MASPAPETTAGILIDSFERIDELIESITDSVTAAQLAYRPDSSANTIGWLLWHTIRVQDAQISDAAGVDQVWTSDGWQRRFALPLEPDATGYGHSVEEVGAVQPSVDHLNGYQRKVHEMTVRYLEGIDSTELARIVDERWDPPVTVAARIVSIIGDCLQHLGQASYVQGLAERAGV